MGECNFDLILHGSIVLLLSQIAGYAFFRSIKTSAEDPIRTNMWRMSHSACSAGAVFLIALGPVAPQLSLTHHLQAFLVASLIISTYALGLGSLVAGFSGHRGTRPRLPWPNLLTYALYIVGAVGSTIAGILLLYGAALSYGAATPV